MCGANRIGHATRLIEDESLLEYVNDRRIPLEICLTSNVQTRATKHFDTHPLREYYDRGLNVVLNTDNRLMSDTTLTDDTKLRPHTSTSVSRSCATWRAMASPRRFFHGRSAGLCSPDIEREILDSRRATGIGPRNAAGDVRRRRCTSRR